MSDEKALVDLLSKLGENIRKSRVNIFENQLKIDKLAEEINALKLSLEASKKLTREKNKNENKQSKPIESNSL